MQLKITISHNRLSDRHSTFDAESIWIPAFAGMTYFIINAFQTNTKLWINQNDKKFQEG